MNTFAGTHPFRPVCLKVEIEEELGEGEEEEAALEMLEELVRRIDDGWCPRCEGPLPELPVLPAGSRITACRCVPVCSACGQHESFMAVGLVPESEAGLMPAVDWAWNGPDAEEVVADVNTVMSQGTEAVLETDDIGEMRIITADGVGVVRPRPHPGGWAEFGYDDAADEADEAEHRGR